MSGHIGAGEQCRQCRRVGQVYFPQAHIVLRKDGQFIHGRLAHHITNGSRGRKLSGREPTGKQYVQVCAGVKYQAIFSCAVSVERGAALGESKSLALQIETLARQPKRLGGIVDFPAAHLKGALD